jgi:hypothetical protein
MTGLFFFKKKLYLYNDEALHKVYGEPAMQIVGQVRVEKTWTALYNGRSGRS